MHTMRYSDGKAAAESFPITVDCEPWLGTVTISSVVYAATDLADGSDVTSTFLKSAGHTNTTLLVEPWVQAGTAGKEYEVTLTITNSDTSILKVAIHIEVIR